MLACNETITLLRHIAGKDSDTYERAVLTGASWFCKVTIVTTADGATPASSFEVRVMTDKDIKAKPGDYVARGKVENITAPKELKGTEHFRVDTVGDNRRGRQKHWRLSGS